MGEAVVTCAKCGAWRTLHGSAWEVKVMADVWQNEHARAGHDGEVVSALPETLKTWNRRADGGR